MPRAQAPPALWGNDSPRAQALAGAGTAGRRAADRTRLGKLAQAALGSVSADQGLRPADLITLARGLAGGFGPRSSEFDHHVSFKA